MREGSANYPMLRRRRRAPLRRRITRVLTGRYARLAALAALVLGVVAALAALAARADRPDPHAAFAAGQDALKRGNLSAARNHFIDAVQGDAGFGAAQVELGRTYVKLEDGVAAEGAFARAIGAGVPAPSIAPDRAAALLLQGEPDEALTMLGTGPDRSVDARRTRARALAAAGQRGRAVALLQGIVADVPKDAGAWIDLAGVQLDMGDAGGAGASAARATAANPRDLAALTMRGRAMRLQYGLVAALPWFEAALRRDAYYYPALVEYSGTLGDAGRYRDSLSAAEKALAARPGDPQALYLMSVIAARAGKLDLAGDLLDRTGGALDGMPAGLLLSGGIDYAAGRYEQAVVKWRALVGEQPMSLVARRLLGAAMLRSGDVDGALEVLRPMAIRRDADSYTLGLVARAFEAKGNRGWAARYLDRAARAAPPRAAAFGQDDDAATLSVALDKAPRNPAATVAYLRGLIQQGRWQEALTRAQAVVRTSPGVPAARLLAGDVAATQGRFGVAAQSYVAAAGLAFDRPTMLRLVEAWSAAGKRQEAIDAVALYAAQNPVEPVARRVLANLQLAAGDGAGAVQTLGSLVDDLGGRDALVMAQLSYAYTSAGDPRGALPYARAAYRLQPMSPAASDAYGWALYDAGNTADALQLLQKAVQIAPRHAGYRWHYAQALADAGNAAAARQSIAIALADPGFGERAAAAKLLAALPA